VMVLLFGLKEAKWKCRISERSSAINAGTYGACRMERADLWNAPNAKVNLSVALKMTMALAEAEEIAKGNSAADAGLEGFSLSAFNPAWCHGRAPGWSVPHQ